jgi:hypothetical protein
MPLFYFSCNGPCRRQYRKILASVDAQLPCPACTGVLKRTPRGATANVNEILDNGFMIRAVERNVDAERLFAERANTDPLKEK